MAKSCGPEVVIPILGDIGAECGMICYGLSWNLLSLNFGEGIDVPHDDD
jgi:hypothetical protein